eukprot:CAMPEP_0195107808 /NCGR_PEP_ID=MMETSP0448-20130528/82458_1 /TAXON_ID=66468 /ORGANISM="Heterocapsa triquestra, Strain CCMP 448" /LENGTH=51 /DNA_ID=CAMNT_0040144289 /DNA_START=103 /DNA_END=255 /DNA_ORIENTATION=+
MQRISNTAMTNAGDVDSKKALSKKTRAGKLRRQPSDDDERSTSASSGSDVD